MATFLLTPAVLAGSFAAAIALAPAAAADDDDLSGPGPSRGSSQQAAAADDKKVSRPGPVRKPSRPDAANSVPGWSNEALWARPGASNQFGGLPKPPIFALD